MEQKWRRKGTERGKEMKRDRQASLTISRVHGDGDFIEVRIRDEKSFIEFVTVKVELAEFAQAITGLAAVPCELETRGLDKVGKYRHHDKISFPINTPSWSSDRREIAAKELLNHLPEGWFCNDSFNNQGSFTTDKEGNTIAHASIVTWSDERPKS